MSLSMYQASVPVFTQSLKALSIILDKTAAHCEARKIEPEAILNMRLAPDMYPFVRQVRAVTDHALTASGRIAGVELVKFDNTEASFAALKQRVDKTVEFLSGLKPEQIDGSEEREIAVPFGSTSRNFQGQALLLNFSLPNFYFHLTTAYNILRHAGVEIGKRDFMGPPRA